MATEPNKARVRIASQIHSDAVSIVVLRAFADSIRDTDSVAMIRHRARSLINLKLGLLGLCDTNLDDAINDSALLMERADKIVGDLLAKASAA